MSLTLTTAFKRFDGALAAWLVADATIASLTGHTADAPRIYIRAGDEEVPLPCLAVDVMSQVAALADVDGIYIARVSCSAFAVDPQVTEDIIAAVAARAAQNLATRADATFESGAIKATSARATGAMPTGAVAADDAAGVYVSGVELEIIWRDAS